MPVSLVKRSHLPVLPEPKPNAGAECPAGELLLGKGRGGRWVKIERDSWVSFELDLTKYGPVPTGEMVQRLNWMLSGWANYYRLGQVSPAYAAIDAHATKRLRQWLCRKHKVQSGKYVRFSHDRLWTVYGLVRLAPKTKGLPWATA
ncbi:MAG: hypothetical protein F4158_09815 [Synechococcus sp. SB0675_bin_7]|nr:hypothetical protein [Synechococcus sp. SB0675_bin_7]